MVQTLEINKRTSKELIIFKETKERMHKLDKRMENLNRVEIITRIK